MDDPFQRPSAGCLGLWHCLRIDTRGTRSAEASWRPARVRRWEGQVDNSRRRLSQSRGRTCPSRVGWRGRRSVVLKYQSLRTRWRRYQEGQVSDHGERIKNARTKAGWNARAEALRLQREDYAAAVPDDYPHRWLGCPERFAQKSLSELWRATGLCIACGVRAARESWHAHCYETCSPKRHHYLSDDRPLPNPPPPPLRTKAPSRSEAIATIQLKEEQDRRDAEARKWPECSSCGDIFRRRTARRHCLRCRPPGQSGIRAHLADLIGAQRGACGICSKPLPDELDDIHVDHIIPRVHGGTDSVDNLQATHSHCNLSKGAKLESGA